MQLTSFVSTAAVPTDTRNSLLTAITQVIQDLWENVEERALARVSVQRPPNTDKGDWATNAAMVVAKSVGVKPIVAAQAICDKLVAANDVGVMAAEVAPPGFINLRLGKSDLTSLPSRIFDEQSAYGQTELGQGRQVLIEFVSANPTGPLHVGHGRGAIEGDVLASLMSYCGWKTIREYYVNDAGRQMEILALSVWLRYLELTGKRKRRSSLPPGCYEGRYLYEVARNHQRAVRDRDIHKGGQVWIMHHAPVDDEQKNLDWELNRMESDIGYSAIEELKTQAREFCMGQIRRTLRDLNIWLDEWSHESIVSHSDELTKVLTRLVAVGRAYKKDGATWFMTTGDDPDRVLVRSNGAPTYFLTDLAYHLNKCSRCDSLLINVWGSDHHGYEPRLQDALSALGQPKGKLDIQYVQFASVVEGGEQVSQSTRKGSFDRLSDLVARIGKDATRYFYTLRRADQPLEIDLELATSRTKDNPVYYVQYAHARASAVKRLAIDREMWPSEGTPRASPPYTIEDDATNTLLLSLDEWPNVVKVACERREPHRLSLHLWKIAREYHSWYAGHRIIDDDLDHNRMALSEATRIVMKTGLDILGVTAPEKM